MRLDKKGAVGQEGRGWTRRVRLDKKDVVRNEGAEGQEG